MSYEAIITPVVNVRPHPNADRIELATAAGHQVIVKKGTQDGTLGVFFPVDGQLSHEMCLSNNLYRKHPETGESMGGFFDHDRRVRTQKFRGEKSEGYWTTIDQLAWTGVNVNSLKPGTTFTSINGREVCKKYYSAATARAIGSAKKSSVKEYRMFHKHFDTGKLRYKAYTIPANATLILTEKLHGTSGRTGRVKIDKKLNALQAFWNKRIAPWLGASFEEEEWSYISGTRRTTMNPEFEGELHSGKAYRYVIHNRIKSMGLRKGETLYYEIVGFSEDGGGIMPPHSIKDDELRKEYGDRMVYRYGCGDKEYRIYVYRITLTNEDGNYVELSWPQVKARCIQLGLDYVPEYLMTVYDGDADELMKLCAKYADGPSVLDETHIREGVCVRIEHAELDTTYKYKGFWFCDLEGIAKNSDEYIDPEEIS